MSIDSNLGMMLFSGDMSGVQSIGGLQGMVNGMGDASEGSAFQQLLAQMLAGNNAMTDIPGTVGINAGQGKSGGTGDLLSALLFAGGNAAKTRLLNTVKMPGESMESLRKSGEARSANDSGGTMEMLQAMMAGLNGSVSTANIEKILAELQNGTSAAEAISTVGSVMTGAGKPEMSGNKQFITNQTLQSGITQETVAEGVKAAKSGTPVLTQAVSVKQTAAGPAAGTEASNGIEKAFLSVKPTVSAGLKELDSSEKTEPGLTTGAESKTTSPKEYLQQEIKAAASSDIKQTAVPDITAKETAAAPADKPKRETEAVGGMDPDRIGFQNSVQGAVTANGTAEMNPQTQQVQAPEQYSQIRDEILTKLEQNGPTEFKMQLEPEDLGQIDIKLKLSEGKLVIDILAANSKTQALLTSQVDKLISSMGLQNVQVENVQISQQMNSQTQDNSQSQGFSMNSAMDFSQRRQQEQYQQEILRNANLAGTFRLQQDETQADIQANRIGSTRYDSHRMNYTV